MKKTLLPLILLALVSVGCNSNKSDDNAGVGAARTRGVDPSQPANLPRGGAYSLGMSPGTVGVDQAKAVDFNNALKNFVSSNMNPKDLGTVATMGGVVLMGQVNVGSGNQVTSDSWVELEISDSYVGMSDPDGNPYEPVRVHIGFHDGYVSGNTAHLVFADEFGSVTMDGSFDTNYLKGTLSFNNTALYVGAPASEPKHSGTIGGFSVSTCGFFRCQ